MKRKLGILSGSMKHAKSAVDRTYLQRSKEIGGAIRESWSVLTAWERGKRLNEPQPSIAHKPN